MKADQILEYIKNGSPIIKQSYTKFKNKKIVRGSFYEYTCGGNKITERQFDNIFYRLKKDHNASTLNKSVYIFNI